jgi:hypothetical protein
VKGSSISKTRKLINKRTVLCLTLLLTALYVADVYLRYRSLFDDGLMLELIKGEERVEFEYVQLGEVKMNNWFLGLLGVSSPSSGRGLTMYVRYFTVWKYYLDEVNLEYKYKQSGCVDMRHHVKGSDSLEGNVGFI